jgi:hypothetical protein
VAESSTAGAPASVSLASAACSTSTSTNGSRAWRSFDSQALRPCSSSWRAITTSGVTDV